MARKTERPQQASKSEELRALEAALGGSERAADFRIDGALLSMVIALIVRKGAAIQFGSNKEGNALAIKIWDGGFPVQRYALSSEEATKILAATGIAYCPKGEAWDEWRNYMDEMW